MRQKMSLATCILDLRSKETPRQVTKRPSWHELKVHGTSALNLQEKLSTPLRRGIPF